MKTAKVTAPFLAAAPGLHQTSIHSRVDEEKNVLHPFLVKNKMQGEYRSGEKSLLGEPKSEF